MYKFRSTTSLSTVTIIILTVADMPPPTPNVQYFQFADDTAFLALRETINQIHTSLQTTIEAFMQ